MKNIEVELKFQLLNANTFKAALSGIEPTIKMQHQKDIYFNPPHKDFLASRLISEWLRLRKTEKNSSINYKNWHIKEGENTVSCDEQETVVENFKQMYEILSSLGFIEIATVEKYRTSWIIDKAEISIDEVTDLGSYIEIEAKGDFSSIEEAKNYIYNYLEKTEANLGEQDFRGYPFRILEKKGYKF